MTFTFIYTAKFFVRLLFCFSLFIGTITSGLHAQPEDPYPVAWADQFGSTGWDYEHASTVDVDANVLVTGYYYDVDEIIIGGVSYSTLDLYGIFVAKYDPSGNVLWVAQSSSTGGFRANGISTDGEGNVFVTGHFKNAATFYSASPYTDNVTLASSNNSDDVFIVKYTKDGQMVWVKNIHGNYNDEGLAITTDASGNCLLTGYIDGEPWTGLEVIFGDVPNTITLSFIWQKEIFVAKYTADGEIIWAKKADGDGGDYGTAIATDNLGNCLVTGYFNYATTFGPGETNQVTFGTYSTTNQLFVAKFSHSDGKLIWAKNVDDNNTMGYAIATDNSGNCTVTGYYSGPTTFGEGSSAVTLDGTWSIFLAKYSSAGDLVWAKQSGGDSGGTGYGVDTDNSGNIYQTGSFSGSAVFGPGESGETSFSSDGYCYDIFVSKYDPDGNLLWARRDGGTSFDEGFYVNADASGNVYVSGIFRGTTLLGADETDISMTQFGTFGVGYDYFIMKLQGSCQPPSITETVLPADPVSINDQPVFITVNYTDTDYTPGDNYTCTFDFGDGSMVESKSSTELSCVSPPHNYANPGVYTVVVTVTDGCGDPVELIADEYIVIYDPSAGFVTGGGWIDSPEGAYIPDPSITGKAHFGFVSKYKKGQIKPDGNTEFQFHAANMIFKSVSYDWLIIAGEKAMCKGDGAINGAELYGFQLNAIDADLSSGSETDKFRIKIWDKTQETIIYDNNVNSEVGEANTEIAGGSIVIHVQKNKSASVFSQINGNNIHPFVNVYPNPTTGKVILDIENFSNPSVKVEVIHLTGQKVLEKIYALPGQIELDISGNTTGLYFIHAEIDGQKCIRKINYIEN